MLHDRLEEREEYKERLLTGASLMLLAPRRIGKTWLIEKLEGDMSSIGWMCIRIDVEGRTTEEQFLQELCIKIEETQHLKDRLKLHIRERLAQFGRDGGGLSAQQLVSKPDPRLFLESLVAELSRANSKTLIIIDEIALFILERSKASPEEAVALLYHLRKLQQGYRNVQWFLTGSVGLDVVARRYGMAGALVDYDCVELEPFSPEAARSYIDYLCEKKLVPACYILGDEAFDRLVAQLGWLAPYYLRQIALKIRPTSADGQVSIEDVDRAFEKLLESSQRTHFAPWEEHIVKNFPEEDRKILSLLLIAACDLPEGASEIVLRTRLAGEGFQLAAARLKDLLSCLVADGFLQKNGSQWAFRSGLLRRYWMEYHR